MSFLLYFKRSAEPHEILSNLFPDGAVCDLSRTLSQKKNVSEHFASSSFEDHFWCAMHTSQHLHWGSFKVFPSGSSHFKKNWFWTCWLWLWNTSRTALIVFNIHNLRFSIQLWIEIYLEQYNAVIQKDHIPSYGPAYPNTTIINHILLYVWYINIEVIFDIHSGRWPTTRLMHVKLPLMDELFLDQQRGIMNWFVFLCSDSIDSYFYVLILLDKRVPMSL